MLNMLRERKSQSISFSRRILRSLLTSSSSSLTQYCYGYAGDISCTADVENGHKLKRYRWFGLKEEKGLIAQLYWADKDDFIEP